MIKQKHITPSGTDIVNQSNQVSRASYIMPVVARRLIFLAMAQVRNGSDDRSFTMPVAAVLKSLGMADNRGDEIREITKKLMSEVLDIETDDGWVQFQWVNKARYLRLKTGHTLSLTLSEDILPYAKTLQRHFHQFKIADIAKLQGRYALRLFELISANQGYAGKEGNPPGVWFFQATIEELRKFLALHPTEYPRVDNLRKRVIDAPVDEINKANLGLRITVEYGRQGKYLTAIKFICTLESKGEPKSVNPKPATETEIENLSNRSKNPEKWQEFYALGLLQPTLFDGAKEEEAEGYADSEMRKWLAEKKPATKKKASVSPKSQSTSNS